MVNPQQTALNRVNLVFLHLAPLFIALRHANVAGLKYRLPSSWLVWHKGNAKKDPAESWGRVKVVKDPASKDGDQVRIFTITV